MYKRFAILQTAFIGDVALSLPLAQAIRDAIPDSFIAFITTPVSAPLAACASAINEVVIFDKRQQHRGFRGLKSLADEIRKQKIKCVISPHRSLRSTLLSWLIHPTFSVGFSTAAWSFLYQKRMPYHFSQHETQRVLSLFEVVSGITAVHQPPMPIMTIAANHIEIIDDLWKKNGLDSSSTVALAPGSVWATKRWPAAYYTKAAQELHKKGFRVVAIGGKEDRQICEEISSRAGVISLAGLTTLPQTLQLLKRCRALLTNDSAPAHLARLVGTPSITVFGPTSPLFGFASQGEFDRSLEIAGLQCRPCAIHGGGQCPLGSHECMKAIQPQTVVAAVVSVAESALPT